MDIQSLLFGRDAGWTVARAKAWAKAHGYKHSKTDVTDQYIRIRQFDPKGLKVKRTITLGHGIRAVVAREVDMKRKRTRKTATPAKKVRRSPRRRAKRVGEAVAETKRRPRRRAKRARETVAAPRRRAKRRAPARMMEAKRRPRRKARRMRAWPDHAAAHRKAAKKGWAKRKRTAPRHRKAREAFAYEARKPRRRARRARETLAAEARRSPRRSYRRVAASRGGDGMNGAEFAVALVSGGFGFVLADALDRFLATYNPAGATKPTDKFTSDGAGTLANALNIAATPQWTRLAAGVGMTALPAAAGMFVSNPMLRSSLEGMALGSGVKLFSLLWDNLLMPLFAPKDAVSLQKSVIARLYPAEISAKLNLQTKQTTVPTGTAFGALSAAQQSGVGAPDVGPFALATAGDELRPSAADVLRQRAAGVADYPSAADVLRQRAGIADYPSVADALRRQAGVSYEPAGPPEGGTGPQAAPHTDPACGCIGDKDPFLGFAGFLGDTQEKDILVSGG